MGKGSSSGARAGNETSWHILVWVCEGIVGSLAFAILKWAWDKLPIWALVILVLGVIVLVWFTASALDKDHQWSGGGLPVVAAAFVLGAVLTWGFLAIWGDVEGGGDRDVRVAGHSEPDDCGRHPATNAVEVMVVWERAELRAFCRVVSERDPGVRVTSVGPLIGRALDARLAASDPPDVAIIPQPSLIRSYASDGDLCPTPDGVAQRFPGQWRHLVSEQEGGSGQEHVYGAVVKGAHKSLFWYRRDVWPGGLTTWRWRDLTSFLGDSAATDDSRFADPLALPAGDRWPLTDWFENQLAGTAPDLYDRLSEGETVDWDAGPDRESLEGALRDVATVWDDPRVFAGGPDGADQSSWRDLPRQVDDGQAALAFGPSFLAGPVDGLADGWNEMWPVTFPELAHGTPLVVGGDFAVVPKIAGGCTRVAAARDLVDWLTDRPAMRRWIANDGGFITPNYESPYLREVAPGDTGGSVRAFLTSLIIPESNERLHFDLSDDQFAVVNGGDASVTWNIFHDYFQDVTGDVPTDCAVGRTIARLKAVYRQEQPVEPC
jgi:alpha-glucoside transport system substrate-binding protein